ncbi:outer membrane protein (attachment invasion locus protein) [Proteus mirabilis]|uniref:Outer membrane protein (Attachment invasion locus protein) n=1 Tax=Proteus mirabilis TaxID=584 RepID=A0A379GHR4_PROMI|nr:outer membrane protein (attachment invasion locus protein) [Proteus mirabilis]
MKTFTTMMEREKENKISMAYGLGVQVNPITNLAIDVSYEYSKLYDIDFTTWVVGIGYRFLIKGVTHDSQYIF